MADSQSQVFDVNLTGGVVTMSDFDPLRGDQLDFGDISVHGLILGQLADGTAIITSPWSTSNYIVLEGVRWTDLTAANFVPVGNEHLRQDIGAVLSWEQDLGPRDSDTVYLRSHEYGVQERVENFDPQTQKLNFLYLGTRERLSVEDTSEGLLISTEPSGQSLLLVGVLRTDLVAANLEFHHDQVMEDNLEEPFGFSQDAVSLVSRQELFTPPAPEGDSTDGLQVRSGESVQAAPEVVITEVDHSSHGHDHVMGDHGVMEAMAQPTEALMLSVSGSLYWGGMGGTLTVANVGDQAVEDWSLSFLTRHQDFQSWAGDVAVVELEPGLYEVSLTPASWNNSIAAGGSLSIDFNATSVGLPNAGALTSELFFAADPNTAMAAAAPEPAGDSVEVVEPVASPQSAEPIEPIEAVVDQAPPEVVEEVASAPVASTPINPDQDVSLQVSLGDSWSGTYSGTLELSNTSSVAWPAGWSATFISADPLKQTSNLSLEQELLADGRYAVTVSAASWAADQPLAAGASVSSYFQASGDLAGRSTDELFSSGSLLSSELVEAPAVEAAPEPINEPIAESAPEPATEPAAEPSAEVIQEPDQTPVPEAPLEAPLEQMPTIEPDQPAPSDGMRVVGYFEEWGIYSRDFTVADVQAADLTHLNYSFFDVKANGDVTLFDSYAATEKRFSSDEQVSRSFSAAEWAGLEDSRREAYGSSGDFTVTTAADGDVSVQAVPMDWNTPGALAGNLRQLELLKELNPELNLGIALGGWTLSDEFSLALDDAAGREAFTSNVIDTLEQYSFITTVDFDWEYPGGGGAAGNAVSLDDGANFEATLQLLRQKLDGLEQSSGQNYEISIATAGGADKLANLNLEGIDPYVDFYNVMAYDFHGGWESSTGHQAAMTGDAGGYDVLTAIDQFDQAGIDRSKVVLGAPAYTRAWGDVTAGDDYGYGESGAASSASGSFEAGNYDYKDILTGVQDGSYTLLWDDDAKAAYAYNADALIWSSMETTATIAGKASYVEEAGLGGMMFWALSNDASGDQSLIGAASDVLMGQATAQQVADRAPGFDQVIGGDGAFALTDFTGLA
mgnify:FL=1